MTSFEDWHAINALLMAYADNVDLARFDEFAAMFAGATYRIQHGGGEHITVYQGRDEVRSFLDSVQLYPDGTPRTKHVITNVAIEVDGDTARASSYATVLQATDDFPLQPIASGRYLDEFARVDGRWRFTDRLITAFLLGDRSHHVTWDKPPENMNA